MNLTNFFTQKQFFNAKVFRNFGAAELAPPEAAGLGQSSHPEILPDSQNYSSCFAKIATRSKIVSFIFKILVLDGSLVLLILHFKF